jgi:hypothetical protein
MYQWERSVGRDGFRRRPYRRPAAHPVNGSSCANRLQRIERRTGCAPLPDWCNTIAAALAEIDGPAATGGRHTAPEV